MRPVAASQDHETAAADLLSLGADAGRWGIVNPAAIGWRSAAALSRSALGDRDAARALAEEEIELARRWGAAREIGVALRAAGLVTGGRGDRTTRPGGERAAPQCQPRP